MYLLVKASPTGKLASSSSLAKSSGPAVGAIVKTRDGYVYVLGSSNCEFLKIVGVINLNIPPQT